MAALPSSDVIRSAQTGNSSALSELTKAIRPHVERQLARYPVSDEDRRDLLQSTLMQVVRRLDSFRGESSFSTWLFRVTANEALMLMRSQRRHRARLVEGLELDEMVSLTTATAVNDDSDILGAATSQRDARIREALAELPEAYRTVVVAHYHNDLGLQEIADRLKVSESAVRSRLHRARSRLRSVLMQDESLAA